MPQPRRFQLTTPPPIGQRRCPACVIEPTEQADDNKRTFECWTCSYSETLFLHHRVRQIAAERSCGVARPPTLCFVIALTQRLWPLRASSPEFLRRPRADSALLIVRLQIGEPSRLPA